MLTLWDLVLLPAAKMLAKRIAAANKPRKPARRTKKASVPAAAPARRAKGPAAARYDEMTSKMLEQYGVRCRKWRSSMSGIAWQVQYRDGSVARLIEAPRPRGPMSAAVFLHEIGHHAIGFNTYSPRCLEEYHAWRFAMQEMDRWGLAVTDRVKTRMTRSLQYAVAKAKRRGIKRLPPELEEYWE